MWQGVSTETSVPQQAGGFITKRCLKNFEYCHVQIEIVPYWFTVKQSMSNHVLLCQDIRYLLDSHKN